MFRLMKKKMLIGLVFAGLLVTASTKYVSLKDRPRQAILTLVYKL